MAPHHVACCEISRVHRILDGNEYEDGQSDHQHDEELSKKESLLGRSEIVNLATRVPRQRAVQGARDGEQRKERKDSEQRNDHEKASSSCFGLVRQPVLSIASTLAHDPTLQVASIDKSPMGHTLQRLIGRLLGGRAALTLVPRVKTGCRVEYTVKSPVLVVDRGDGHVRSSNGAASRTGVVVNNRGAF